MSSGVTRFLSKISWWLFGPKRKYCHACCLNCQWYDYCRKDVEDLKTVYGEVWE